MQTPWCTARLVPGRLGGSGSRGWRGGSEAAPSPGSEHRVQRQKYLLIHENIYSTVLYCWVAAITTKAGEFVCTGTLVAEDLVVTSGSCINL